MNRHLDVDETLSSWLDEGVDHAPERFVWAALDDVERTSQWGAWRVSLENRLMQIKQMAPVLGVAAVIALAVIAYQVSASNVGAPIPTPREIVAADLPSIIVTEDNLPAGLTVARTMSGEDVMTNAPPPDGSAVEIPSGFVDGLLTDLSADRGRYATVAMVYETAADAEREFDAIIATYEADSPDGWGLTPSSTDPGLGDQSVAYTGPVYGEGTAGVYAWRVNNVVLIALGFEAFDAGQLLSIAEGMDSRAH